MTDSDSKASLALWLFTLGVVFGLTLPVLIQDGMFQDAVLYSAVSHNLAIGHGSFWFPQYSYHNVAGLSSFHEQPPLVFGIQALFFKLLGDSMYVERFYTFLMLCLTIWLIRKLWKESYFDEPQIRKLSWLPVLLWIAIPLCFWSYRNNMHENTLGLFSLAAVVLAVKALRPAGRKALYLTFSGLFIFLAVMSKGVPGIFPVMVPFLHYLFFRRSTFKQMLWQTILILSIPALLIGMLFLFPESRESLSIYLNKRLIHRVNAMPNAAYRLEIIVRLLMELIPSVLLCLIALGWGGIKGILTIRNDRLRSFGFIISVGMTASFPLALTLVQKGFYLVPSFPYFAIGLAMLAAPSVLLLLNKLLLRSEGLKWLFRAGSFALLFAIVLSLFQMGKTSREDAMLHDVHLLEKIVPKYSVLKVPPRMYDEYDFRLQGFLVRYANLSLDTCRDRNFYLTEKNDTLPPGESYKLYMLPLERYKLYIREMKIDTAGEKLHQVAGD